jgi:hypothetical protein
MAGDTTVSGDDDARLRSLPLLVPCSNLPLAVCRSSVAQPKCILLFRHGEEE